MIVSIRLDPRHRRGQFDDMTVHVPIGDPHMQMIEDEQRALRRRAAIGMFSHLVGDRDIDVLALKADDRWNEHYGRKFADPD